MTKPLVHQSFILVQHPERDQQKQKLSTFLFHRYSHLLPASVSIFTPTGFVLVGHMLCRVKHVLCIVLCVCVFVCLSVQKFKKN